MEKKNVNCPFCGYEKQIGADCPKCGRGGKDDTGATDFRGLRFLPGQKCVQQQDKLVDQQEGLRGSAILLHSKHGCGGGAPASERGQLYRNV